MTSTGRNFLKTAGTCLIAFVASACLQPPSVAASDDIHSWVTGGEKRCADGGTISWSTAGSAAGNKVTVDFSQRKQDILGFGGAFTDAACFTFNGMSAEPRAKLFKQLFSPDEMNLSVGRVCMGASDYSTHVYSYDEGDPDPDMKRFSTSMDNAYVLPMLREARKANPDLFLLATPWSPPGWMKPNNSMLGGNMQRKSMEAYAKYFVKFLQEYQTAGVPIQSVSVQNEVDTDQDGRMPACSWPQEYEADFVRTNLGPSLETAGLKTKIWIIDHNYNLWGRAICELETENMEKFVGGVAWHGYVGHPEAMTKVHDAYPNVPMYWTEGGPDYTQKDYNTDWANWSSSFSGILNNWAKSIIVWNLSLDEQGKPNIGPFPCGGLVTVNSKTKDVSYSGQYWALAQFSRFIQRGAHIVATKCDDKDLRFVAAENPSGKKVVVATNTGSSAKTVSLQVGNHSAELHLDPGSVSTFVWN